MALFYPHYNGFVISNLDISSCCARPLYSTVTKPAPGPPEFQVLSELSGGGTKEVRSHKQCLVTTGHVEYGNAICIYIYILWFIQWCSVVFSAVLLESQLGIAGVGGRYPQMQKKTDMDRFPHSNLVEMSWNQTMLNHILAQLSPFLAAWNQCSNVRLGRAQQMSLTTWGWWSILGAPFKVEGWKHAPFLVCGTCFRKIMGK